MNFVWVCGYFSKFFFLIYGFNPTFLNSYFAVILSSFIYSNLNKFYAFKKSQFFKLATLKEVMRGGGERKKGLVVLFHLVHYRVSCWNNFFYFVLLPLKHIYVKVKKWGFTVKKDCPPVSSLVIFKTKMFRK